MGVIEANCSSKNFNILGVDYTLPAVTCDDKPLTLCDYQEIEHHTCCYQLSPVQELKNIVIGNGITPRFGFPHFLQINYTTKSPSDTLTWDKNYILTPSHSDANTWISFSSIFRENINNKSDFFAKLFATYHKDTSMMLSFGLEYCDYVFNYQNQNHSGLSFIDNTIFNLNYEKYLTWLDKYEPVIAKIVRNNVVLSSDYKIRHYQDYINLVKYHHYFGFYIPETNKIILLTNQDNLNSLQDPNQYLLITAGLVHEITHQALESMQLSTTPSAVVLAKALDQTGVSFNESSLLIEQSINSVPENEWLAIAAEIDYLKFNHINNEQIWEYSKPYLDYNISQFYQYLYPQLFEASIAYFQLSCPALNISQETCEATLSYIESRLMLLSLGFSFTNKFLK